MSQNKAVAKVIESYEMTSKL